MHKPFSLIPMLVIGISVFFMVGCQNHLRNIDKTAQEYEREIKSNTFLIKPYEYNRDEGKLTIQLYENRVTAVKLYENHRTMKRSTPYEWWREFYEVPVGLVVFPIGIVSHVLNVFSFGIFPYRWCWAMDCYGLSSLNPFLNAEDEDRIVDEPLKNARELIDQREENEEILKVDSDVMAIIGEKRKISQTDSQGRAVFWLLKHDGSCLLEGTDEKRIVISSGGQNETSYDWIVPRTMLKRVNLSAAAIRAYKEKPSPEKLADTIKVLETNGFVEVPYLLEQEEFKKHKFDKTFKEKYERAMGQAN